MGAIVAVNSAGRTFDTAGNFFAGFLELGDEVQLTDIGAAEPGGSQPASLVEEEEPVLLRNTTIRWWRPTPP